MAQAAASNAGGQPWTLQLYARLRVAPVWIGLGVGGGLILLFLASELALGRHRLLEGVDDVYGELRDFRITLVHCLLVGYAPTAYVYALRRARRTWQDLRGTLGLSPETLAADLARFDRRPLVQLAVLIALAVGLWIAVTFQTTPPNINPFDWSILPPETLWHRVLGPAVVVWATLTCHAIVRGSWLLSRTARRIRDLDLLDGAPLEPFRSQALANSLVILGFTAFGSLFTIESGMAALIAVIWFVSAVTAGIGLLLPLLGVRDRIREARRSELAWCNNELRRARDTLKQAADASTAGRLAELFAYKRLIEEVREWPLDAPSFVRFLLYLLLPLGSWLGGALVERLVDATIR